MKPVRFSLRQIRREWRSGELGTLAAALVISAAALSAVGSFSQRIERGLTQGANELLAADLVVQSRRIPQSDWVEEAKTRGLATASLVEFPTVAFAGENSLLVQAKAVTDGYPLRGQLLLSDQPYGSEYRADGVPPPGEVWLDARVVVELQANMGDLLELGDSQFRITAVVAAEPDRANSVFSLAPRAMINMQDLEPAGLIGPGSRVSYRFLVAGEPDQIDEFEQWVEPKLEGRQFIQTLEDSQQQVSQALDRAGRFLVLAALTAVLLAGIAVVIAVRQFVQRHLDTVAILRCLGSRQRSVVLAFSLQLLWLGLPALLIGVGAGYLIQNLLVTAMGELIPDGLPGADWRPGVTALATGLLAMLGYGLPPLMRLRDVPPVRVLNRQLGNPSPRRFLGDALVVAFSVALVWIVSGDHRLGLYLSLGVMIASGVLAGVALLLIRALRRLARGRTLGWRFGVANVAKNNRGVLLQISGLGLGLMAIFLLGVVQNDLMRGWRDTLPENTPNYFLINLQPEQVETARAYFEQEQIDSQGLFPMAVSKLKTINGAVPNPDDFESPRARYRIQGNINISWADEFPLANTILEGEWWSASAFEGNEHEISLARSWAETMELGLGDQITFEVGSQEVTGTVTSIREVDWDSFQPNFFVLFSPGAVGEVSRTYISSVFVPDDQFRVVSGLVRQLPNVSVLDVGSILARVRTIIDRVTLTVQVVFVFTLMAGVVVLLAALNSGLIERVHEGAVLRTLGGSSRQLRSAVFSEFAVIGAVAGVLSASLALAVGAVLARQVFEIEFQPTWWLPLLGIIAGGAVIGFTGLLGSRPVLKSPPMATLRRTA